MVAEWLGSLKRWPISESSNGLLLSDGADRGVRDRGVITLLNALALLASLGCARHTLRQSESVCVGPAAYARDVDFALRTIREQYVYVDDKDVDWSQAQRIARESADTVHSKRELVGVLERLMDNLYDPHAIVRANTSHSPRLVPSGLDTWAEWRDTEAVVTAVRPSYGAELQGVRPGMRVIAINGIPIESAAAARLGAAVRSPAPREARAWSLLSALAGRHDTPRVLRVRDLRGEIRDIAIDSISPPLIDRGANEPPVEGRWVAPDRAPTMRAARYGYVRLNALDDERSVSAFDSVLETFRGSDGLILDLRNTPGGGNTGVAEPILGRFITRVEGYQQVVPRKGRAYVRTVAPRGPWTYNASLVVLVGRWTGSMGEGMAIGLDGMHRAVVVGTRMAGLAGAVDDFKLPCSGISIALPTARLLHVNGTPRDRWVPPVLVDLVAEERREVARTEAGQPGKDGQTQFDPVFDRAVGILENLTSRR